MESYKDFMVHMRRRAYSTNAQIYLRRVAPKLVQIVHSLSEVKFEDDSYHKYYGEVKNIIRGFLMFYNEAVDDIVKDVDRLKHLATKADLLELVQATIDIHVANMEDFRKLYIPLNPTEQEKLNEIEELFDAFMMKMYELQKALQNMVNLPEVALAFASKHFKGCVDVVCEMCEFTYTYLSLMLAEDMDKTRHSLVEIHNRLQWNHEKMKGDQQKELEQMYSKLFELNIESKLAYRNATRSLLTIPESDNAVEQMQMEIMNYEGDVTLNQIVEEVAYWEKRLKEFHVVAANLDRLSLEAQQISEDDECHKCLRAMWEKEARRLFTFYACRGSDRIIQSDNIGKYYVDEYNHQVYVMDHGLSVYHVTCKNEYKKPPERKYFFDKHGRYVYHAGKKMYQVAPCSSFYNLGPDDLLDKPANAQEAEMTTAQFNEFQCRRKIKDPNDVTILPDFDPVDIKNTVDKDNAKYLWDTFGGILSHALRDVAMVKSKNPIHYLAHRLLYHKYNISNNEFRKRNMEADAFKKKMYKDRKEKLVAQNKAWKAKQVKRRKPEESDDMAERAVFEAHTAHAQFINSLNIMNN